MYPLLILSCHWSSTFSNDCLTISPSSSDQYGWNALPSSHIAAAPLKLSEHFTFIKPTVQVFRVPYVDTEHYGKYQNYSYNCKYTTLLFHSIPLRPCIYQFIKNLSLPDTHVTIPQQYPYPTFYHTKNWYPKLWPYVSCMMFIEDQKHHASFLFLS